MADIRTKKDGVPVATPVEPIKNQEHVLEIAKMLREKSPRDCALFVLGVNIGLRAGDLSALRVKDVWNGKAIVPSIRIHEEKTDKFKEFYINQAAATALKWYITEYYKDTQPNDYLFPSRKGGTPIVVQSLHRLVNTWCESVGASGHFGSHTLRKTFGYHVYMQHYQKNPRILDLLMNIYNHNSAKDTLQYIGISQDEIKTVYLDLNLGLDVR